MDKRLSLMWEVAKRIPRVRISRANIALTFRCNQKCRMCSIWKHNNEQDIDAELGGVDIYKIIKRNDLMWVSLTGGEPFLNEQIINILTISMLHSRLVSIVTNGSKPELIADAVRYALRKDGALLVLSLSLEGDMKAHDYITGMKGSYDKVIRTIDNLKHIESNRFNLGIEHLLSNDTKSFRGHVEQIAKEYKIGITYTREQQAPYYHNVNGLKPIPVEIPNLSLSVKPFDIVHNLFLMGLRRNKKLCEAGKYSVFIDPYANVYPCLLQAPNNPIINLRQADYIIGDISKEAKELLKKCPSPCYTPCEVYASMLFRPWRLL